MMPAPRSSVPAIARRGAESVFGYVSRTAEATGDGVRWATLDYRNEARCDATLYSGGAGIVLFLADYFRLTGSAPARALAEGAWRWCAANEEVLGPTPDGVPSPNSLYFGTPGVALAAVRLAHVTGGADLIHYATATADRLGSVAPGPWTDLSRGATGEGLLLLRVWEATQAPRHLGAAVARGEWLRDHAIRDASGCHWLRVLDTANPRSRSRTAFSAGAAGVGHFLLALYAATADSRWAALAGEASDTLLRHAVPDGTGLSWPFTFGGDGSLAPNQWCIGAPGIGWFLAAAAAVLGEVRYAAAACAAGRTTYAAGDLRRNPSQCHGLAGGAELFLALYRLTGDAVWLAHAHDFAQRIMAYRTETPVGDVWPADEPGLTSPDFFCGATGVGHFFLRLSTPEKAGLPFA